MIKLKQREAIKMMGYQDGQMQMVMMDISEIIPNGHLLIVSQPDCWSPAVILP